MTLPVATDRPTLEINLDTLIQNWRTVTSTYTGQAVGAVIKNNAYGLGLERIVSLLADNGCRQFWAASFDEAIRVRAITPQAQIYTLFGMRGALPSDYHAQRITPTLVDLEEIRQAQRWAQSNSPLSIAVHLDTGLSRLGLQAHELHDLGIAPQPGRHGLHIQAWVTHQGRFSEPEAPENAIQFERFLTWTHTLPRAARSIATSSGVFADPQRHLDLARVGSALYGVDTTPTHPQPIYPVARLVAPVLRVADIATGTEIGYAGQFRTTRPTRLATLAIGYANGLPFSLMNRGAVWFGTHRAPIISGVSMGLLSVDISTLPPGTVRPGSIAEIFGARQRIESLAETAQIPSNTLLVTTASLCARRYITAQTGQTEPLATLEPTP